MKHYTVDCRRITTRQELHDVFAETLTLPAWYGRNLDALHDCLTALSEDTYLMLLHGEWLPRNLSSYGEAALRMLADATEENPHFILFR